MLMEKSSSDAPKPELCQQKYVGNDCVVVRSWTPEVARLFDMYEVGS